MMIDIHPNFPTSTHVVISPCLSRLNMGCMRVHNLLRTVTLELSFGKIQIWHLYKCSDRQRLLEDASGQCERHSKVYVVGSTYIDDYKGAFVASFYSSQ